MSATTPSAWDSAKSYGSTSRLAAELASRLHRNTFDSIFWIDATSVTSFMRGMEYVADALELPPTADATSHANAVKAWMETHENGSWLMILDAASHEAVSESHESSVDSKEGNFIRRLPQRSTSPLRTILVTTCQQHIALQWCRPELAFEVPFLAVEDAASLLRNMSGDHRSKNQDVASLAKELDGNPSALLAAAALIRIHSEAGETISTFLATCRKRKDNSIAFFDGTHSSGHAPYPMTKSSPATWYKTIESVKKWSEKACDLLFLISCLDGTSISPELFRHAFGWKDDILELRAEISTLLNYRLISRDKGTGCYRMSKLVRLTVRSWIRAHCKTPVDSMPLLKWHLKALESLLVAYDSMAPQPGHSTIKAQLKRRVLLPHAAMFQQFCRDGGRCNVRLEEHQFRAIVVFSELFASEGRYRSAKDMLGFARESPVPQSYWRKIAMLRLAESLRNQMLVDGDSGRLQKALSVVGEVQELVGDAGFIELWSTLALLFVDKGKFAKAAYYQSKVVLALSREPGDNSFGILDARLELSKIRWYQGHIEAALHEQKEMEYFLQAEPLSADPDSTSRLLQVQAALVRTYYTLDRLDQAIETAEKVVKGRAELLGDLDMKTIGSEKDLAQCLAERGETSKAMEIREKVERKLQQKFGFDHEEVRGCVARLDGVRKKTAISDDRTSGE